MKKIKKMTSMQQFEIVRTLMAIFIALAVGFVIILLVSKEPISAIQYFVFGPLTKQRYLGNVVEAAIPLMFSGVATALLFQTNLFNLGAEGIYYFSGLVAAIVGMTFDLPPIIHAFAAISAGAVCGMLVMLFVGFCKAKWDASELVLSLMFNSILYGLGLYLLNYYFRETNSVTLRSRAIRESALLNNLIPNTRIHTGLILAILTLIVVHLFLYKTRWGYELRMVGSNPNFATYSGMSVTKTVLLSSAIAGLISGMGGSVEILGMYDSFKWAALPGLGFDGALIAMLAKNKPINVIFSALFLAYIRIGADLMARMTDVPSEMIGIMQGIIILLFSGQKFLQHYKHKLLMKGADI